MAFGLGFLTNVITFLVAQIWLSDGDKATSLTDPGVLGALAGNAAGITLMSLIALGLGALLRSVPAAIGAFVGAVLILPEILGMLPYDAVDSAVNHFPTQSAESLGSATHLAGAASPAMGCGPPRSSRPRPCSSGAVTYDPRGPLSRTRMNR